MSETWSVVNVDRRCSVDRLQRIEHLLTPESLTLRIVQRLLDTGVWLSGDELRIVSEYDSEDFIHLHGEKTPRKVDVHLWPELNVKNVDFQGKWRNWQFSVPDRWSEP